MKKFITMLLAIVAIASSASAELYPSTMQVATIDGEAVTCVDYAGNMWSFDGSDDYTEGDLVACIMDDLGTVEVTDDVILSCRYAGRTDHAWPTVPGDDELPYHRQQIVPAEPGEPECSVSYATIVVK